MDLSADDLILFARVIDAGSFSAAAQACGLPKSTLSRRIAALEAQLGERLLVRTTRRLLITEFGERILDHARRLLDEAESASALAQQRQATPQGRLRASLPPDFVQELALTPFLIEYAQRFPAVSLELDLSPRRVDLIAERFDLAVRVAASLPDDATLVARPLAVMRHGLYASPLYLAAHGRPGEPEDLAMHTALRLIASGGEAQPWVLARGAERWTGMPGGPIAVNSVGLQRELAASGLGIVGLSERYAEAFVRRHALERVLPDWDLPSMTIWAVTPGRRLQPARVHGFIEMLADALRSPERG